MPEKTKINFEEVFSSCNIVWMYLIMFTLATFHKLLFTENAFNNYDIFRYSFYHLMNGQSLYVAYPEQHFDLFKYSPSFALLMGPFWILPRWIGVLIWNLINALLPVLALKYFTKSTKDRWFFALFILIEMLTSVQNAQSNGLMLGLMMLAFGMIEKHKSRSAALAITLGFSIKIFAIGVAFMQFFQPRKKQIVAWGLLFGTLISIGPALFVGFDGLWQHYAEWMKLLAHDTAHELNYSIMAFFERSLDIRMNNVIWLGLGLILLFLPLIRSSHYAIGSWRIAYFAMILVWIVLFNHKTESPTFIIAMAGAALWFLQSPRTVLRISMLAIVFVFTGLSSTDLFPSAIRENIIKPFAIKVLPCILLFVFMLWELLFSKAFEAETNDQKRNTAAEQTKMAHTITTQHTDEGNR